MSAWNITEEQIDQIIKAQSDNHEKIISEIGYNPAESSKNMLKYLIQVLEEHSNGEAYSISVQAYGSGDSGEISDIDVLIDAEEITYYETERLKTKQERGQRILDQHKDLNRFYMSTSWRELVMTRKITKPVENAIEDLCYYIADISGVDWYNNAGGEWSIKIDNGEVEYSMIQNYMESETVESYETEDLK